MNKEESIKITATIPTFTDEELDYINDNCDTCIERIIKTQAHQKDLEFFKRIIIKQKEENQKLKDTIDNVLNFGLFENDCPYSIVGGGFIQELCDCDNCEDDYRKCWLKYFEKE